MDEAQEVKGKVFKDLHFELIRRAAAEIHDHGTFDYAEEQVLDSELCRFFAARQDPASGLPEPHDAGEFRHRLPEGPLGNSRVAQVKAGTPAGAHPVAR